MKLLISTSTMTPIYEQIASQIRKQIEEGELVSQTLLPSVRSIARDYHISALTVKKAYDQLESEGLVNTVQGKGTYVAVIDPQYVEEQKRKQVEDLFDKAILKAKQMGMSAGEIKEIIDLLLEGTL